MKFHHYRRWVLTLSLGLFITGLTYYFSTQVPEENDRMVGFSCEGGEKGWEIAKAISPDVVPPCNSGSAGVCENHFMYVRGTGWCRPTG